MGGGAAACTLSSSREEEQQQQPLRHCNNNNSKGSDTNVVDIFSEPGVPHLVQKERDHGHEKAQQLPLVRNENPPGGNVPRREVGSCCCAIEEVKTSLMGRGWCSCHHGKPRQVRQEWKSGGRVKSGKEEENDEKSRDNTSSNGRNETNISLSDSSALPGCI